MNDSITRVDIRNSLSPDLLRMLAAMRNTRPVMFAAGTAARKAFQDYYRSLPPNKRGFASKRFWEKEGARSVFLRDVTNVRASVSVDSVAMGHRYYGGTVTAKRAGALSIPISPEAYRTGSASLWRGTPLTRVDRPGHPPLLIEITGWKSKAWKIHYILLKSVTHSPDRRAWPMGTPAANAILEATAAAVRRALTVLVRRRA